MIFPSYNTISYEFHKNIYTKTKFTRVKLVKLVFQAASSLSRKKFFQYMCSSFLLLCNKSPQTEGLMTKPIYSSPFYMSEVQAQLWVFSSGTYKAEIRVLASCVLTWRSSRGSLASRVPQVVGRSNFLVAIQLRFPSCYLQLVTTVSFQRPLLGPCHVALSTKQQFAPSGPTWECLLFKKMILCQEVLDFSHMGFVIFMLFIIVCIYTYSISLFGYCINIFKLPNVH